MTTTTGWDSAAPNSSGATANFTTVGAERATTLDAAYTIGALNYSGNTSGARRINFSGTEATNTLTFNSGDSGPATITSDASGNSCFIYMDARVNLADDLVVTNNNAIYTTNPGIRFNRIMTGSGNLTFVNVNNSLVGGQITLSFAGSSTFTGSVLVKKGAVIYGSTANAFGSVSNVITLGSAGDGSASLVGTASSSAPILANNIVVAAGSGGTLLLGNTGTGAVNATFSGTITLNGDVSLISTRPGGNDVRYTNVISGVGSVTTVGTGETQFGNGSTNITNTYSGNTTLSETSSLALSDNAKMTFYIGATGMNNKITAAGGNNNVLTLDGDFVFDLTGAAANGSWQIVDVALLDETFNATTFGVYTSTGTAWTENSNIWTYTNGSVTYSFSEATGVLSAVPEPATALLLGGGLMVLLLRRRRS
ncbi:MAG: PEP-CTERM sorting domain-containing protein [Verrucomicrobia bacterium]|nr:PEP-CTERM sorting domain-containing protein [Verrucomicrobiota bacterium]